MTSFLVKMTKYSKIWMKNTIDESELRKLAEYFLWGSLIGNIKPIGLWQFQ